MKVTVEIDPAEIQQMIYEVAAAEMQKILKCEVADRLRDTDEFWDRIDEATKVYLNSESFLQLIRRVIHSSETELELIKTIKNRILKI